MPTQEHYPDEVLLDYAEGLLDPVASGRVRAHLDTGCAQCAEEVATWTRLLSALWVDRAPAPPAYVVDRAMAIFDRVPTRPTVWQRVAATLAFDSRRQPALAGVR